MQIRRLKRIAIIVKPKAPYIEWANSLDDEGGKFEEDLEPEHTIYLIEDTTGDLIDIEAMIAPHYELIFEEELNAWHRLERDWPTRRDLATFLEWFEVVSHSIILDLGPGSIKTERYWRY